MHRCDHFGRCMVWRRACIEILFELREAMFETRHVTASLFNCPSTINLARLGQPACKRDTERCVLSCGDCGCPVIRATGDLSKRDGLVSLGARS